MELTIKQTKALDYLDDDHTTELYYGGAAGGGKSALGCYWQMKRRVKYPGTRGLIGRAVLKTLKETTLQTFFEIAKKQGLKRSTHFELTSANDKQYPNCLVFWNGSLIYLKDLQATPQDPDFDELGSLEITDAFLDEAPQITVKGKNIVRSRIRFALDQNGLIPKMMMSGNPSKNWAYHEFYKPNKEGTLRPDRKFVQALPGDNPHLPKSYVKSLEGLDKNSRERLLEGNWEYDDDPSALISYEKILNCFTNDFDSLAGEKYITSDIARLGSDRIVIGDWDGWRVKPTSYNKQRLNETHKDIDELRKAKNIPLSQIIVDEDGVGGGIVDFLGCNGFVNNSRALANPVTGEDENYASLKDQCGFRLAERINKNGLFIECDEEIKELIIEELECVKQWKMDRDVKKKLMPKEEIKKIIGRSPDFLDMLLMREWFELGFVFKPVAV